jgi:hypothetical protein
MPSRFEKYRMKDGATPLAERYFNPIWQDLDLRLAGIEELEVSWEAVVRTVTDFGLLRINEVLAPAFELLNGQIAAAGGKVDEIEAKRQLALQAIAQLQQNVAQFQTDAAADISAWKVSTLAALQDALASVLPPLTNQPGRILVNEAGKIVWGDLGGLPIRINSNTTLTLRRRHHIDTTVARLLNMPPDAAHGDWLITTDVKHNATLANITLNGNGALMPRGDATYVMDMDGETIFWIFDSTDGWVRA